MRTYSHKYGRVQFFTGFLFLLFVAFGCATLPTGFDRPPSYAFSDTQDTLIGRKVADDVAANPGKSGFSLLSNGLDAFVARALLAQFAERSIDAQYYLYHNDLVGGLFTHQLLKAADRGVRVRLLVDDMDLEGRDSGVAALDAHPNIEFRIFNPFSRNVGRASQFITRLGSVTRRMHNKSFTVDNQATVLGGRNIGNEYFEADPDLAFGDLDVMGIGPVAKLVSASFDKYWNSASAYPVAVLRGKPVPAGEVKRLRQDLEEFVRKQDNSAYLQALENSSLAQKLRADEVVFYWGEADVIYDLPEKIQHSFDKTEYHLSPQLIPYLKSIEKELVLFSPYFVPGKEGTAFLSDLARRGVRVRILTNSLASNDVPIVHSGYAKYRKDLLRAGVELFEMNKKLSREERKEKKGPGGSSKASLHAKSFVFDRRQVFIGSLNFDPRAWVHNTEIGVVFSQPAIATAMSDWVERNIDKVAFRLELVDPEKGPEKILWRGWVDGEEKTFDTDPYSSFWQRLGIGFLGLLPIESQL
ncbi:MAG: phospholipase D family protein [Syntrophaceae bacterium]|nr:phospholipase D family protein [Syntrophaceae bacterium]